MTKYLKCMSNGRVFEYTDILMARGDMRPCDETGNTHDPQPEEVEVVQERKVTPFLGNPANGSLYPYTEILAQREDLVSIESEEQWMNMMDQKAPPADNTSWSTNALPEVSGMGPREAKTVLSDWAYKMHNKKIDRRPALDVVIAECQSFITGSNDNAGE